MIKKGYSKDVTETWAVRAMGCVAKQVDAKKPITVQRETEAA